MILIMLLSLVHLFLHRLFMTWAGDGSSTFLSFLVAFNVPTSGSTPAIHKTHTFLFTMVCGLGKNTLPYSAVYKIRVYRFEDETLRNFPVEWGTQIQVHGIWTKILPGQGSFLLTLGCSAMFQVVEFAERPTAGEMGL